jgi:hypothetical protein
MQDLTGPDLVPTTPWPQRNAPWFAWLIPAVLNWSDGDGLRGCVGGGQRASVARLEDGHAWALALGWCLRRHQGLGGHLAAGR